MILTHVVFDPHKNIGRAYNAFMERLNVNEWGLLIDDDIWLRTQPKWYAICEAVIKANEKEAGLITCVTNRIGCRQQRVKDSPRGDDLIKHIEFANKLYSKYGNKVIEVNSSLSGMFMLTSKRAWELSGGFRSGFLGVDNNYCGRVRKAGFKTLVIPGLYVYHGYKREWKGAKNGKNKPEPRTDRQSEGRDLQ